MKKLGKLKLKDQLKVLEKEDMIRILGGSNSGETGRRYTCCCSGHPDTCGDIGGESIDWKGASLIMSDLCSLSGYSGAAYCYE